MKRVEIIEKEEGEVEGGLGVGWTVEERLDEERDDGLEGSVV